MTATPNKRSLRRRRLVNHLYACGPRPVLEALLAVDGGADLDAVLTDFARLPPRVYRAIGADYLDAEPPLFVFAGGRR